MSGVYKAHCKGGATPAYPPNGERRARAILRVGENGKVASYSRSPFLPSAEGARVEGGLLRKRLKQIEV